MKSPRGSPSIAHESKRGALCSVRAFFKWLFIALGSAVFTAGLVIAGCAIFAMGQIYVRGVSEGDRERFETLFINFDPPSTGTVYDANGEPLIRLAHEYRYVVTYSEFSDRENPSNAEQALIVTEDQRFWEHGGIDWIAISRAAMKNIFASAITTIDNHLKPTIRIIEGGSTIDQQMVRLLFLPPGAVREKSIKRKLTEARLAVWINKEMQRRYMSESACIDIKNFKERKECAQRRTKEDILARYVSLVYFGHSYPRGDQGRFGFKAAAEYYFAKDIKSLDVHEAALLTGIIKLPGAFSPTQDEVRNVRVARRRNYVLERMRAEGFLSDSATISYQAVPIGVPAFQKFQTVAPYALHHARKELTALGFSFDELFRGDLDVRLTVDARIQRIVNTALDSGIAMYESRHPENAGRTQGAVVIFRNSDAAILAEAGGRFMYDSTRYARYTDFNRATEAFRQAGSAFKPFVYITAFKTGWTLADSLYDGPICIRMGWGQPRKCISNYDGKTKGWIPLRQCLAESRNMCTMRLASQLDLDSIIGTARQLGIHTELERYPTTALGASVVTLEEITNAYRTLATGFYATPYIIEAVSPRSKPEIDYSRTRQTQPVLLDTLLALAQEALRSTIRLPSGTGAALNDRRDMLHTAIMGKTGTTNDFRDALFIGSTPGSSGITVGVWIGIDDYRTLGDREAGARAALPIFKEIIQRLYDEKIILEWPRFSESIENNIDAYLNK